MTKKKYKPSKKSRKEGIEAIKKAIKISGGVMNLAELLGVSRQMIFHWKTGHKVITVDRALQIEKELKGEIKLIDLRPDIFDIS